MATDTVQPSELDAFQRYVDERYSGSLHGHSLSEAIEEFRVYQSQLTQMREKIRRSEASGSQPLTEERLDALCDQWEAELQKEGSIP